jgi:hypothetical protein
MFAQHHRGFSQGFEDWCDFRGVLNLFFAENPSAVRAELEEVRVARRAEDWAQFASMKSTSFAATIFQSPGALYSVLFEASKISRLGVRAALLSITGTLSLSYCRSKCCTLCGSCFSFEHFLECDVLGPCVAAPTLLACVDAKDWPGAARLLLSRFEVFVHAIRGGELSPEESELFDSLVQLDVSGDDAPGPVL